MNRLLLIGNNQAGSLRFRNLSFRSAVACVLLSQPMITVADVVQFLDGFAPPSLAEQWDNVGLLVGDRQQTVQRVMTCLTITPDSAAEAVAEHADLVITHHPLPFRPLKRLTSDTHEGRLLWQLMGARISVYSAHTAFDSAEQGINFRLATGLQLGSITPLVPNVEAGLGTGRFGVLKSAMTLEQLAANVKQLLAIGRVQAVGPLDGQVRTVAVACGSAGELLAAANTARCDALVTGEVRFHTALEAEAMGVALVLAGHFASERFAIEQLSSVLAKQFPTLKLWASQNERDPLHWL
jgi:dinuclear metal center YbgI/SA1388 family protein